MTTEQTITVRTEERKNRFSGESIKLTKEEAIIHDRIFVNEIGATLEDKELGYGGSRLANLSCPGANAPGRTDIYIILIEVPHPIPIKFNLYKSIHLK